MFAAGLSISKVSNDTGYSRRRLQILLTDPTFQDLIAEMNKVVDEKLVDQHDTYAEVAVANMLRAEYAVQDRLEAEADEMPIRDLLAISKDRADRFGYSAKHVRVNVNLGFAEQLDRAISRSEKVIENVSHSAVQRSPALPMPLARLSFKKSA